MNGTLSGFIALFIWSTTATLMAYIGRLPPLEVTALTWLVAALSLAVFFGVRGENLLAHCRRPIEDYLFVTFGVGVYTALYYMAFTMAPVFEANTLNYLWPIFLMGLIIVFQNAPVTRFALAGMLMGFAGCAVLFFARTGGSGGFSLGPGHMLSILAAMIWAFYSCFSRRRNYPVAFLVPVFVICGIGTFVAHLLLERWIPLTGFEWIVVISLGFARLGYVFWDHGMRAGNQVLITSASYFTPLFSTLFLMAAGFGAANGAVALAAALIIVGCLAVNGDRLWMIFAKGRA